MEQVSLGVPRQILDSLPEDDAAGQDMQQAVRGIESRANEAIEAADDAAAAAATIADVMEWLESRMERYDDFVPELRAWGQSPIYAIAWRNLYADLVMQLYDYDWLAAELERERNYRLVEDGIRFGGE